MGPGYDFLPAPLWLVTVLHILTLTLHFVAMNFLLGGVIVVLLGKFEDRWNNEVVQKFVHLFPSAMAATVTLGVAPLLFLQLTYHKQVYAAAIISGWWWLGIVIMAIIAYYFFYAAAFGKSQTRKGLYLTLALVGLVYISYMYSSIFSMAEHPAMIKQLYATHRSGWVINPSLGDYILRWLHMVLGAITVGGFFVGLLGSKNQRGYQVGKMVFLWGMVAAMVAGLAYMLSLTEILVPFMSTPAVWFLLVAIILSAGSLHFYFKKRFWPAGAMLFVSMLCMVTIRHYVRRLFLEGVWEPAGMAIRPQWGVFVIFLLCFVAAIGALWYMLRLYFADRAGQPAATV